METAVALNQFLTFNLGKEFFAIDVAKVNEVLSFQGVTKVPRLPDYVEGVINLRGLVVPVVDIRKKFGMGIAPRTENTCVIISEVEAAGEMVVLGLIADNVSEVVEIFPQEIEPAPRIGTTLDTRFIKGMGKKNDAFIIILAIDNVFTEKELGEVAQTA